MKHHKVVTSEVLAEVGWGQTCCGIFGRGWWM